MVMVMVIVMVMVMVMYACKYIPCLPSNFGSFEKPILIHLQATTATAGAAGAAPGAAPMKPGAGAGAPA